MIKTHHFEKGTTLIELLLYIALLSVILVVVIDLLLNSGQLKSDADTSGFLQQDAAQIRKTLTHEIHLADNISTPNTIGQLTNTLILTVGGEIHTFSNVGTNLQLQKIIGVNTFSDNLNSNQTMVNSPLITFQNLGNSGGKTIIKATFTITVLKPTKQGQQLETFTVFANTR